MKEKEKTLGARQLAPRQAAADTGHMTDDLRAIQVTTTKGRGDLLV